MKVRDKVNMILVDDFSLECTVTETAPPDMVEETDTESLVIINSETEESFDIPSAVEEVEADTISCINLDAADESPDIPSAVEMVEETYTESLVIINSETEESFDIIPSTVEEVKVADHFDVGGVEVAYRDTEKERQIAPVIQEVKQHVTEEVKRRVDLEHDRVLIDVYDVMHEEVGYRLKKLNKHRRSRRIRENATWLVKAAVIVLIAGYCYSNMAIRTRIMIVATDIVELVKAWGTGDSKASNKLVDDLLRPLGDDLNDISTYDRGFTIEESKTEGKDGE